MTLAACAPAHVGAGTTQVTGIDETVRLAEAGDPAAQTVLGNLYETGAFGAPDFGAAAAWYRRAADRGDPLAAFFLANLYEQGKGVGRDPARAAQLYRAAAEAGHPSAAFKLGYLYEQGQGVPRDFALARRWYDTAEQGWGAQRVLPLTPGYLTVATDAAAPSPTVTLIPVASLAGLPVLPETVTAAASQTTAPPAPPPPGFYLHLASQRTPAAAAEAWNAARARFPDLLDGLSLVLARLDLGTAGLYYQVFAGPLAREEDADIACALLQPQGQYCDQMPLGN